MKKALVLGLGLIACTASAANWRPPDRLLHAVRFVESSHGLQTFGDHGLSLGDYQISEAAWIDVNAWRKARGLPTYKYDRHVWDKKVSREYAADYMVILYRGLEKHLRRAPTSAEVYAAYNMGLSAFAQCHYRLTNVNPTTARKCELILAMMDGN